jgi:diguanylate cyclase (GGDEF)-like protein
MSSLDPRSLIILAGFMTLVMSLVLGFMRRYYPPSVLGLGYWAWTPVIWTASIGMFVVSNEAWIDWIRLLGNGLLIGGYALFYIGCRRFFAQPSAWQRVLAGWGLTMLALAWFSWGHPSYDARATVATLAIVCLYAATLGFLWRHGSRNFPVRMVQFTLSLHMVVLLVRLLKYFSGNAVHDLMAASMVQTLYLGSYALVVLLLCIGAVLMATDRVRTELEHMASHDALTGTLNRRAILDVCAGEHERSVRYGQAFSLMMIDLDYFKAVNDTHGHQHGDRVLVHFANCTRAALRRADRFGRYGGEEFLAVLPHAVTDAALPVAERIRTAQTTGHALACTASIGVTHWRGPDDSLDAMLGRADAALYQAKAQGRNRVHVG